jgi:hypothetical protein
MKKIIFAAIAVMAFGFTNAQKARFGVKGGLNISNFSADYNTDALVGFQLGGFAEIKVIDKLVIQPELLFSAQGAKYSFDRRDYNIRLNYFNIPVLAKYYITKEFTVEAGPQLGFLVSATNDGTNVNGDYKTIDAGFNLGAGYNFNDNLSLGLRYTIGLSGIEKDRRDYGYYGRGYDDTRSGVLALSLAYKF